jgi:Tfp pilus assembly pilus retraction ATPase PilT
MAEDSMNRSETLYLNGEPLEPVSAPVEQGRERTVSPTTKLSQSIHELYKQIRDHVVTIEDPLKKVFAEAQQLSGKELHTYIDRALSVLSYRSDPDNIMPSLKPKLDAIRMTIQRDNKLDSKHQHGLLNKIDYIEEQVRLRAAARMQLLESMWQVLTQKLKPTEQEISEVNRFRIDQTIRGLFAGPKFASVLSSATVAFSA